MVHVTAFFAGILALFYIGLSFNVIRGRYQMRLALGHNEDTSMLRRIRAHANFAEYVPLALVLMGLNELNGSSRIFLIIMGVALVIGRISHAYSLLVAEVKSAENVRYRSAGMVMTFGVLSIMALAALL